MSAEGEGVCLLNGSHVTGDGDVTRPARLGAGGARGEDVIDLGARSAGRALAWIPVPRPAVRPARGVSPGTWPALLRLKGEERRRTCCQRRAGGEASSGEGGGAARNGAYHRPPPPLLPWCAPSPSVRSGKGLPALLRTRVPVFLISSAPTRGRVPRESDLLAQRYTARGGGVGRETKRSLKWECWRTF